MYFYENVFKPAGGRRRPRPKRRATVIVSIAATLAFILITSVLFFLSFDAIVPLYANRAWINSLGR